MPRSIPLLVADYCNQGGIECHPLVCRYGVCGPNRTRPLATARPQLPSLLRLTRNWAASYVTSDAAMQTSIQQHWQSLIEVAFEGEVMWLRYADNRVFPKMLTIMSQQELDDVLGPCLEPVGQRDSAWQRTPDTEFTPRQAPWFRIQPHHLTPLYDESRHAYILSRHFWQRMEDMMARHPNPEAAITTVLKQANQAGLAGDVLDGVVAGVSHTAGKHGA